MSTTTRVILLLLCSLICAQALQYPLKVVYIDQIDCCSPGNTVIEAVNAGFNVIILAFYETGRGVADAALAWSQRMDNATRIRTMKKVHDAGAVVTISLGGANDHKWGKANPVELATTIATFAKDYNLDGVDFDLEVFGGFNAVNEDEQQTIDWFGSLITTTRSVLGPHGVISLAPLAPWFGPIGAPKCDKFNPVAGCSWVGPTGGMTQIYRNVGQHIDFFFNQFYNQGACYQTEAGLFMESGPSCTTPGAYYPQTSIKELHAQGIPLNKIVIGKPVDTWAGVGYTDPATIKKWIENSGKQLGWNAGVGIWQWWDVMGSQARPFIQGIYPQSSTPATPKPDVPATDSPTVRPTVKPVDPTIRPPVDATTRPVTPTAAPATVAPTNAPATQPPAPATQAPAPATQPPAPATQPPAPATQPPAPATQPPAPATQPPAPATQPPAPATQPPAPATRPPAPATQPPQSATESPSDSCTDGHMKCAGTNTYSSCAHGKWQASQFCQTGLVCRATEPYIYCV